jgi:anti-anti-sigma factor
VDEQVVGPELVINTERDGARAVLTVQGELDAYTAPGLEDHIAKLLGENVTDLVLDLAQTPTSCSISRRPGSSTRRVSAHCSPCIAASKARTGDSNCATPASQWCGCSRSPGCGNTSASPAPDTEVADLGFTSNRDAAGAWSVHLRGALDLHSAAELQARLDELLDAGALLVVLHLGDVEFLDSSGLRTIVATSRRLGAVGGKLLVAEASGAVLQVLEITGVLQDLTAAPAVEPAPE